ncbi:MAG: hypothetical protein KBT04_00480 [Bacteroidales bacterium]|nr:hypothetical protein [Candidatus Colimorpha onthohippi]
MKIDKNYMHAVKAALWLVAACFTPNVPRIAAVVSFLVCFAIALWHALVFINKN